VFPNVNNPSAMVTSVAIQNDGGIVVGGDFALADNQVRLGLARFQADPGVPAGGGGGTGTVKIQSPTIAADGTFSMQVIGTSGQTYQVQASPDLKTWTSIGPVTGASTPQPFSDSAAKGLPHRFYRVMGQ
jgi:hypothetical protein